MCVLVFHQIVFSDAQILLLQQGKGSKSVEVLKIFSQYYSVDWEKDFRMLVYVKNGIFLKCRGDFNNLFSLHLGMQLMMHVHKHCQHLTSLDNAILSEIGVFGCFIKSNICQKLSRFEE